MSTCFLNFHNANQGSLILYSGRALEQAAEEGPRFSLSGDIPNPPGHSPVQPDPEVSLPQQGVGARWTPEVLYNPDNAFVMPLEGNLGSAFSRNAKLSHAESQQYSSMYQHCSEPNFKDCFK